MTGMEIAALIAMIVGAGVQYHASSEAQERQRKAIEEGLRQQEALQREAEKKALDNASKYTTQDRRAEQHQIAEEITANLMAPVSESQAIRSEQQATVGNVSNDYQAAKAKSDLEVVKGAETTARLLGKTTAANRLRLNEGIRLMDTGQAIDQLGNFSQGSLRAAKTKAELDGQVDPGSVFAGQILGTLGSAGLMSAGSDLTSTGAAAKYGTNAGSTQSSMLAAQEAGMGTGGFWNGYGNLAKAFGFLGSQ